ncbi:MAG: hypothetical protein CME71_12260 [Halobacteriovorax sp.]|nr:hypothetical protein [Halobacteriovorax sp.]
MRNLFLTISMLVGTELALAQQNSRALLPNQPVLSQMTGNCYTHSGADVLTGIFLRENRQTSTPQPHPLLLGGIVSADIGRANISSGLTCDFFNEAKNVRGNICSVEAFNSYVASTGVSVKTVKDNINLLDRNMKKLQDLFDKSSWSDRDKAKALKAAQDIVSATCNLNGIADLDNPNFLKLLDDSREIISRLSPRPVTFSSVLSSITEAVISGPGVFLSRRIGDHFSFSSQRRNNMNQILESTYEEINTACMSYATRTNKPKVASNFFSSSDRFTCRNEIYKKPRLSRAQTKPQLDFIDRQVRAGYPTGIYVCSAIFYAKYPTIGGYRERDGDCKNGGGHAVTVTGIEYRNGKRFFKIRNSWGTGACRGLDNGRRECRAGGVSGCPTKENSIDCKDGVYYMSDNFLSLGLYGHTRLTVPRSR